MKRYLIFATVGPLFGGLLLLFARTVASGYWTETRWSEVGNFFVIFAMTLPYSYLFLVIQALMAAAIDDILLHVRKIRPLVRMLIVGAAGFAAGELLHGLRGPDSGLVQFILHGLSGFMPAMISSWLAQKYAEQPQVATNR
jgi:multisubunit Na+/H+ antiporter MnhB subunit